MSPLDQQGSTDHQKRSGSTKRFLPVEKTDASRRPLSHQVQRTHHACSNFRNDCRDYSNSFFPVAASESSAGQAKRRQDGFIGTDKPDYRNLGKLPIWSGHQNKRVWCKPEWLQPYNETKSEPEAQFSSDRNSSQKTRASR